MDRAAELHEQASELMESVPDDGELSPDERKRCDTAFSMMSEAIGLKPNDAEFLSTRASVLMALGKYTEAIPDLDGAIVVDPKEGFYLAMRAEAKEKAGRLAEAIVDYDIAMTLDPEDSAYNWDREEFLCTNATES